MSEGRWHHVTLLVQRRHLESNCNGGRKAMCGSAEGVGVFKSVNMVLDIDGNQKAY